MPMIPPDPIPFALTGIGSVNICSGRSILWGWSVANAAAVASQFRLWDGPITTGTLLATDVVAATSAGTPFSLAVGIQVVTDLNFENVAAATMTGCIWVLPETKILSSIVSSQSRGGGVQAYLTNMLQYLTDME